MRPIWTGAIGFGLVNIPVKLYSATKESNLDLDMLDKKDLSNIKFMRINEKTGKAVAHANIVKGFMVDSKYVILDDKDFENASAVKTKFIEISDFVLENEIESIYYEMPYYVAPEKSGERAYALLKEALLKTGKVGIATFVMRNKEHLSILKATDDALVLNRLRFSEEIRDVKELEITATTAVKPGELKMAISLINQLSGNFKISTYKDNYTAQLLKLIKAKARGTKPAASKMKVVHSKAKDLMEQLKESLSKSNKAS